MTSEDAILKRELVKLRQFGIVAAGPGDDCAVLNAPGPGQQLLIAADQLILDMHFTLEDSPFLAAAKLFNRNLSDIAAMGGTPVAAVQTVALNLGSSERETAWLSAFFDGLSAVSERWCVPVCGGDLSRLKTFGIVTTLTITGTVEKGQAVFRSTGKPGMLLGVTGRLGNSFASGRHLSFTPRLPEGRLLAEHAGAMMDISDGLLADLKRLCSASNCGACLDVNALPLHPDAAAQNALYDGEDYELLFAVEKERLTELKASWTQDLAPLTMIGSLTENPGIRDISGNTLCASGWDPFQRVSDDSV